MSQDRAGGTGVHRLDLGSNVIELGEAVDADEDIGKVETILVPEE